MVSWGARFTRQALLLAPAAAALVLGFGSVVGTAEPAAALGGRHQQPDGGDVGSGDGSSSSSSGAPIDISGLPREGIAVRDGEAVLLLSTGGKVLHRLDGLALEWAAMAGPGAGDLALQGSDRHYRLDAGTGELRERRAGADDARLSYGATLVSHGDPRTVTVERDGAAVFDLGTSSFVVSYDRDIVTRSDPDGRATAYDLRHSRARRLPRGCDVADRHGPSWFLTCVDGDGASRLLRWRPGGRTSKVLAVPPDGGTWSSAMVSPDGRRFLAAAGHDCGSSPTIFFGSTSGGRVRRIAHVVGSSADAHAEGFSMLGWTLRGDVVVQADTAFGSPSRPPGVYAIRLSDKKVRPLHVPTEGQEWYAAMWTPSLEHRPV